VGKCRIIPDFSSLSNSISPDTPSQNSGPHKTPEDKPGYPGTNRYIIGQIGITWDKRRRQKLETSEYSLRPRDSDSVILLAISNGHLAFRTIATKLTTSVEHWSIAIFSD
jgi:hypothetical protein